ncbi:MAG: uncharacterized protein PWP04_1169 [Candidatus Atribacteria bacterium]|nr:uncharacterized protein [Candidatus Atribacteria bacterium]
MEKEEIIPKLKLYFQAKPEVALAFLFGSVTRGRTGPESDVDVAVYFYETPDWAIRVKQLWGDLEAQLSMPVDLIVLNNCAPGIAMSALRGIPLSIKDRRLFQVYLLETSREAEDFHLFIEELYQLRLARRRREKNEVRTRS